MSKETITVLSVVGVGFVVTLVGGISWALKKKVGLFVALIGVAILFSAFLFIPKSEDTPESPTAPAKTIMISEIKADYDANTLSADDMYKGNRYRITGTIEKNKYKKKFFLTPNPTNRLEYLHINRANKYNPIKEIAV
jgi:hypothetical protein